MSSSSRPPGRTLRTTLDPTALRIRSKTITHAGGRAGGKDRSATRPPPPSQTRFPADAALSWIRENVYGREVVVPGPFGPHPRRYFDYTASGLPFRPIEELLLKQALPYMSNTHSMATYASEIVNSLFNKAHDKVRKYVRATDDDVIVFTGSGTTGAINKLINSLGLRLPEWLRGRVELPTLLPPEKRPVVLLTRMEHHSNDLPWRESIADIEFIGYDDCGRANWRDVDRILSSPEYRDRPLKLGSFTAASNVTGVLNDTCSLAAAIHGHDGYAFFDFAAAAPYIPIDLHPDDNPAYRKDAVFISMHKFTGGPQCPGLLLANRAMFSTGTPTEPGGGTVMYTSPWEYRYVEDPQQREEGGTPPIVAVIRAGLVFDLKAAITTERLQELEHHCVATATKAWRGHPKIHILGPDPLTVPRLGILSVVLDGGQLHHNLAVRLFNDLFGIQVRGGCMCAGTYGHDLLQIDKQTSKAIRDEIDAGNIGIKPGWVRISFGPAVGDADLAVLLEAVPFVADRWRDYLDQYEMDPETAEWRHKSDVAPQSDLTMKLPVVLERLSAVGIGRAHVEDS